MTLNYISNIFTFYKYKNISKQEFQIKMVMQEDLELTSSHEYIKSTATYGTVPSEKDLKTS